MKICSKMTQKMMALGVLMAVSLPVYAYERIVAMSPDVGDIIVALGGADKVVGKDAIDKNPALKHVKAVGMHRNLTAESVLSVKPDLALGSHMVQPASVYQRLNQLKIKAVNVAPKEDVASFVSSIEQVAQYLGKSEEGKKIAKKWQDGMAQKPATKARFLLSYDGRHVAGKGTVGDELIRRAGGINAAASVDGFKPLSREGWLSAKPDVVIIADHNKAVVGSLESFKKRPEIAISPAGKNNKIYFWPANDFLRFGLDSPNVVQKMYDLSK